MHNTYYVRNWAWNNYFSIIWLYFLFNRHFSIKIQIFITFSRFFRILLYNNRIMEQNVNRLLKNVYNNYLVDIKQNVHTCYKAKCLGSMETLLIVLGKLPAGQPFDYRRVKNTYNIFWIFPVTLNSKETYEQHILRLVRETLDK